MGLGRMGSGFFSTFLLDILFIVENFMSLILLSPSAFLSKYKKRLSHSSYILSSPFRLEES